MQGHTFAFMGLPGSGKDTQGQMLADEINAQLFSSGAKFREMIKSGTAVGKRLEADLGAGLLMPSWFAAYLFEGLLVSLKEEDNVVFQGGVCRILPEAILFDEIHTWLGRPYTMIYLDVSEEEMKKRVSSRQEGRVEDGEHAIQTRINEYNTKTLPSLEFFRAKGKVVSVNGAQSKEQVHADVLKAIGLQ